MQMARARENLKRISILKTSLKTRVLRDLKTHIARFQDGGFLLTVGTWVGFFFLSLLGKSHQILHMH